MAGYYHICPDICISNLPGHAGILWGQKTDSFGNFGGAIFYNSSDQLTLSGAPLLCGGDITLDGNNISLSGNNTTLYSTCSSDLFTINFYNPGNVGIGTTGPGNFSVLHLRYNDKVSCATELSTVEMALTGDLCVTGSVWSDSVVNVYGNQSICCNLSIVGIGGTGDPAEGCCAVFNLKSDCANSEIQLCTGSTNCFSKPLIEFNRSRDECYANDILVTTCSGDVLGEIAFKGVDCWQGYSQSDLYQHSLGVCIQAVQTDIPCYAIGHVPAKLNITIPDVVGGQITNNEFSFENINGEATFVSNNLSATSLTINSISTVGMSGFDYNTLINTPVQSGNLGCTNEVAVVSGLGSSSGSRIIISSPVLEIDTDNHLVCLTKYSDDQSSPNLRTLKTRGSGNIGIGTTGLDAVKTCDNLLVVEARGYDGSSIQSTGKIKFSVDTFPGVGTSSGVNVCEGEMPTSLTFYTGCAAAEAERLKIDSCGYITFNNAFTFPITDGNANQVLQTDGAGELTWNDVTSLNSPNYYLTGGSLSTVVSQAAFPYLSAMSNTIELSGANGVCDISINADEILRMALLNDVSIFSSILGITSWQSCCNVFDTHTKNLNTGIYGVPRGFCYKCNGATNYQHLSADDYLYLAMPLITAFETDGVSATIKHAANGWNIADFTVEMTHVTGGLFDSSTNCITFRCNNNVAFTVDIVGYDYDSLINKPEHDSLVGFVANEHIDHTSVSFNGIKGIEGGGDISSSRTFCLSGQALCLHEASFSNSSLLAKNAAGSLTSVTTGAVADGSNSIPTSDEVYTFVASVSDQGNVNIDHSTVSFTGIGGIDNASLGDITTSRTVQLSGQARCLHDLTLNNGSLIAKDSNGNYVSVLSSTFMDDTNTVYDPWVLSASDTAGCFIVQSGCQVDLVGNEGIDICRSNGQVFFNLSDNAKQLHDLSLGVCKVIVTDNTNTITQVDNTVSVSLTGLSGDSSFTLGGTLDIGIDTTVVKNNYLSAATFNTSDGILTLGRHNLTDVTVDLDGKYAEGHVETTVNSNSANWDTSYNDAITAIEVTGDTTKTITLTSRDGTTLYDTFTDNNTTYDLTAENGGIIRLSDGSNNDDITIQAGNNVTVTTTANNNICIDADVTDGYSYWNVGIGTTGGGSKYSVCSTQCVYFASDGSSGIIPAINTPDNAPDSTDATYAISFNSSTGCEFITHQTNATGFNNKFLLGTSSENEITFTNILTPDVVNNRLGINVASPNEALTVSGNLSADGHATFKTLTIQNTGNTCSEPLTISGDVDITGNIDVSEAYKMDGTDIINTNSEIVNLEYKGTAIADTYISSSDDWNSVYTSVNSTSATWDTVTTKLPLAGGTITGNLTVNGNFLVEGTTTTINTTVTATSAMCIHNAGTGPALQLNQTGEYPIVDFQDDDNSVFYIENGGNVGIGTNDPNTELTVVGNISASTLLYDGNNNSSQWTDAYNNYITGIQVSGTGTKTITLTQRDGGTIATTFTDNDTVYTHPAHTAITCNCSNGIVLQDITVNSCGHVTSVGACNLDDRYYTESEVDTCFSTCLDNYLLNTTDTLSGTLETFNSGDSSCVSLIPSGGSPYVLLNRTGSNSWKIKATGNGTAQTLDTSLNDTSLFTIEAGGNIGIGTTDPGYKLDVDGTFRTTGGGVVGSSDQQSVSFVLCATNTAGAPASTTLLYMCGYENRGQGIKYRNTSYSGEEWFAGLRYGGSFNYWGIGYDQSGNQAEYAANTLLSVTYNGNVGVGITNPTAPLNVVGTNNVEGPTVPSVVQIADSSDVTKNLRLGYESTWDAGSIASSDLGSGWKNTVINARGGNVGIGLTNPSNKLHVSGAVCATGDITGAGNLSVTGTIYSGGTLTSGTALRICNNSNIGIIIPTTLTGTRTYTLQNASGTLAHTSDLPTNYITNNADDTMSGTLTVTGNIISNSSITAEGNSCVDGTSFWFVNDTDRARQRADARDDATNFARLHWYGQNDAGSTSNFRHAWYDGAAYIHVTATNCYIDFDRTSCDTCLKVDGTTIACGSTLYSAGAQVCTAAYPSNYITNNADDVTTGCIDFHASDNETIIKSGNTSATGTPDQFFIAHNLGNVNIGNSRGGINISQGAFCVGGNTVLTSATSFGGDVSGTYNSIVVANDSHTHTCLAGFGGQAEYDLIRAGNNNGLYFKARWDAVTSNRYWDMGFVDGNGCFYTGLCVCNGGDLLYKNNEVWHAGNDGSGSGLDADTVDGIQATALVRSDTSDTMGGNTYTFNSTSTDVKLCMSGQAGAANYNYFLNASNDGGVKAVHFVNGSTRTADGGVNAYTIRNDGGPFILGRSTYATCLCGSALTYNGNTVWHAGNDGAGSGLDADCLDGQTGSYYLCRVQAASSLNNTYDLNDIDTAQGWYKWSGSGPTNSPATYAWMLHICDNGQAQQLIQSYGGATNKVRLFGRRKTSGSWDTSWTEYWSNKNDGSGSGLDADCLDGQQGVYYLNYNNFTNTPTIPTDNSQLANSCNYCTTDTNTTYSVTTVDVAGSAAAKLRLSGSDSTTDDITFAVSQNLTIEATPASDLITITGPDLSSYCTTDTNTTYTASTGLTLVGTAFSISSTCRTAIANGATAHGWGNHALAGYTTCEGDITNVIAGTGLNGGGTSGDVTLSLPSVITANTYGSTGNSCKIDTITVDAQGRVTAVALGPTGSSSANYYVDSVAFATGTGVLTLGRSGLGDLTVDLDGRYCTTDTNTNYYVNSVAFATGTGVLTLGRSGLGDLTIDLDGRYCTSNTNNYASCIGFNTTSGVLSIGREGLTDLTVDLDGRYCTTAGGAGDITSVTAGAGLAGGGTSGAVTLTHSDTSTVSDLATGPSGNRRYIKSMDFDTYGHVTGYTCNYIGFYQFGTCARMDFGDSTTMDIAFGAGGDLSVVGGSGAITYSYSGTSDYRQKYDIEPFDSGYDIVNNVDVYSYKLKDDCNNEVRNGMMAHELQAAGQCFGVYGVKDGVDKKNNPEYQKVEYPRLIPTLWSALKTAMCKIEDLEARLATLELQSNT